MSFPIATPAALSSLLAPFGELATLHRAAMALRSAGARNPLEKVAALDVEALIAEQISTLLRSGADIELRAVEDELGDGAGDGLDAAEPGDLADGQPLPPGPVALPGAPTEQQESPPPAGGTEGVDLGDDEGVGVLEEATEDGAGGVDGLGTPENGDGGELGMGLDMGGDMGGDPLDPDNDGDIDFPPGGELDTDPVLDMLANEPGADDGSCVGCGEGSGLDEIGLILSPDQIAAGVRGNQLIAALRSAARLTARSTRIPRGTQRNTRLRRGVNYIACSPIRLDRGSRGERVWMSLCAFKKKDGSHGAHFRVVGKNPNVPPQHVVIRGRKVRILSYDQVSKLLEK